MTTTARHPSVVKANWIVAGPTIYQAPDDVQPCGYAVAHMLNPYHGAVGAADLVEQNAALMASAPALLRAMEDLLEWIAAIDPSADCDEIDAAAAAVRLARRT